MRPLRALPAPDAPTRAGTWHPESPPALALALQLNLALRAGKGDEAALREQVGVLDDETVLRLVAGEPRLAAEALRLADRGDRAPERSALMSACAGLLAAERRALARRRTRPV